ncbi:MAG: formamidopyrimidine-DNA glycosylase [Actinomycetota bacterium]|jgi:formamidopyrimidine-DNA glycosylase|nr:formamidopyrimidine-DNA glycosylase [Actinomycetota bacterium]
MPELPEVEKYRQLAERALGRVIKKVDAPDDWILKRGLTAPAVKRALKGRTLVAARRQGKLLLLDTNGEGPTLGLRFGMTGKLVVDGNVGVDDLIYSSNRDLEAWDRFAVRFADGGDLRLRDSRRLGGVELDPEEARLGPDAASLSLGQLRAALGQSTAPLKARLMDQSKVAGVGNLIADETFFRAGLDPGRLSNSLEERELKRLHKHLRATVADLSDRGGSHTGDFQPSRVRGGLCPKDGTPLIRRTVGGRTTYHCPRHQV